MILRKLTDGIINELQGRDIYFVRFFRDYVRDVYRRFPELPFVKGAFDTEASKLGVQEVEGRSVQVSDMKHISELSEKSVLIITTGYYREEYEELIKRDLPVGMGDVIYYFANQDTEYYEEYLEKYKDVPLKDLIVFRSGMGTWEHIPGMDFTENSRALFEYLQREGFGRKYEMVWLVKEPSLYQEIEKQYEAVSFVSYDWAVSEDENLRDRYYRAICLAKYFFFTHACAFCRLPRPGQTRVQLWHGCGFKTVKNTISQKHYYEYTTVVSSKYAQIHQQEFGLEKDQTIVTGYAKEDWLFHPVEDWKRRLGVPCASKYIFWLPTFRRAKDVVAYMNPLQKESGIELPIIESMDQLKAMNSLLEDYGGVLVVKLHPLQKDIRVKNMAFSNICFISNEELAKEGLHINEILGDAAALISDYSSAAVDYLLLDRPIGFTLDDLDEYRESRGFVLNPIEEWLPGEKIYDYDGFMSFLEGVCSGDDRSCDIRRQIAKKLHDFSDDNSCKRIADAIGL